jgi:hypothetical protein
MKFVLLSAVVVNSKVSPSGRFRGARKGQCEALKNPICQYYHMFLSRDFRPKESGQKPKYFDSIPTPQAGGAFTFVIATKVNKKARLKKGDCAL